MQGKGAARLRNGAGWGSSRGGASFDGKKGTVRVRKRPWVWTRPTLALHRLDGLAAWFQLLDYLQF